MNTSWRYSKSLPDAHTRNRDDERKAIAAMTEEFKAAGGVVEHIDYLVAASDVLASPE